MPNDIEGKYKNVLKDLHEHSSLNRALIGGLSCAIILALIVGYIGFKAERLYLIITLPMSFIIGWTVKLTGLGYSNKFGRLAGMISILAIFLTLIFFNIFYLANEYNTSFKSLLTLDIIFQTFLAIWKDIDISYLFIFLFSYYIAYRFSFKKPPDVLDILIEEKEESGKELKFKSVGSPKIKKKYRSKNSILNNFFNR